MNKHEQLADFPGHAGAFGIRRVSGSLRLLAQGATPRDGLPVQGR